MGSRFMSLFFGRASNNNQLKGQSYDAAVASDPPVKGSYPVAGNGPNVLEEIQRTRAKRQSLAPSRTSSIGAAPAPSIPLQRRYDPEISRPRTAPHNGEPGGGQQPGTKARNGRTLSGFSMKTPPVFSSNSRRNSISSTHKRNPIRPRAESPPPLPASIPLTPAYIPTYQPKTGGATSIRSFVPPTSPFAQQQQQHSRTTSIATSASHKSHVDLLDAHSIIDRTRETSKHRLKASGVRNYGEDVADRNIVEFGHRGKGDRESRLDLNSPEFSYLKQVYSPKKRQARTTKDPHTRVDSALGHVLGNDGSSDDNQPPTQSYPRTSSMHSVAGPGPDVVYPPRIDSVRSQHPNRNGRVDDETTWANDDRRGRALSPLSSSTTSIREEPQTQETTPAVATPLNLERRRRRTSSTKSTTANQRMNPPPVAYPPVKIPTQPPSRDSTSNNPLGQKPTTVSAASQKTTAMSNTNRGTSSRKSSVSYSAFPSLNRRSSLANDPSPSAVSFSTPATARKDINNQDGMLIEGASEAPCLEGLVDLKDSVDTDVSTRTLPAVVHEHVTPTEHEIRQESITREIHTHDVYHRTLPVIETEILPTKHYIPSKHGKSLIEIPESMVPQHTITRTYPQEWHIAPGPAPPNKSEERIDSGYRSSSESAPDGPIVGLARGDPNSTRPRGNSTKSIPETKITRPRGNSTKSNKPTRMVKEVFHPILSSKKESISKEGHSKTEYVWRHPPVLETSDGKIQPALIPAAFEGNPYYSDDDSDVAGAEFGAEKVEADLLFRDSGYGSGGMLPGLSLPNPVALGVGEMSHQRIPRKSIDSGDYKRDVGKAKAKSRDGEKQGGVRTSSGTERSEGEATTYLRRMKEKKFSLARSSKDGEDVDDLEKGFDKMNLE